MKSVAPAPFFGEVALPNATYSYRVPFVFVVACVPTVNPEELMAVIPAANPTAEFVK